MISLKLVLDYSI